MLRILAKNEWEILSTEKPMKQTLPKKCSFKKVISELPVLYQSPGRKFFLEQKAIRAW
jgi:hypothetical protein